MKRDNVIERILEAFLPNFTEEKTTMEVMKKSKISWEPAYRHLKELSKQKIIKQKKKGKGNFYSLNIENDGVRKVIEKWAIKKREKLLRKFKELKPIFNELIKEIETSGPYLLSLILFGSVARGKFTKKSDIDILVIISTENAKEKNKIVNEIHNICSVTNTKYNAKLSPMIISLMEFYKMLKQEKDFTKKMVKDAVVLYGEEIFYRNLIRRFKKWQLQIT